MRRHNAHPPGLARRVLIGAAALGLSLPAIAQTGPRNPGADVIVGDLIDTYGYGPETPANGFWAFDIGTVSCNMGNVDLSWVAESNQHPVIAQNVYRLKNGRFEQIGLSWVKHGVFALTENLCSTCNNHGGDTLGVGCSDPYDGGLNGVQGGLGPRSQINPYTGAFPFSPTISSTWPTIGSSNLRRRINIAEVDLLAAQNAGAVYFAEGQYVSPDDAASGNGRNNASYRAMRFAGAAPFTPSFVPGSSTQRTKPAIFAWREFGGGVTAGGQGIADASVTLAAIDVPGDGRFWLGCKVIDNGNGTWRYEYAVQNLSSDRAGAGLVVPLPAGATATQINVRVPEHHSGEPYSTLPWTTSVGASSVGFACPETFSANEDAHALRWGTLSSFGFVTTAAPASGSVKLALFKPGAGIGASVGDVSISLPTPGGSTLAATAPVNNLCSQPLTVQHGHNGFTLLGAANSAIVEPCAAIAAARDAWFVYTYTPRAESCAGAIFFDTCGSNFPARLSVYAGGTCPSTEPLACSGDAPAACGPGAAQLSVPATAGATYLVRVSDAGATAMGGAGVLNITAPFCLPPIGACCTTTGLCAIVQGDCNGMFMGAGTACSPNPCPLPPPPSNDLCANAVALSDVLAGGSPVPGHNIQAATETGDGCGGSGFRDVWYSYTPAQSANVTIDLCTLPAGGVVFDTVLSIRTACTGADTACVDDYCGVLSGVTVPLTGGTRYIVRVAGFGGDFGEFTIKAVGGGGVVQGACCQGSTCSLTAASACTGRFAGAGIACNAPTSQTTPCCRADFDQGGTLSIDDIFVFLNAWFAQDPRAAFTSNGAATPTIDDIFIFLNAWFAGCS